MKEASTIKVLIVDDSALVRQTLTAIFEGDPTLEVIGTANDPIVAERKIRERRPDVITLDLQMPWMDGLTFLKQLMEHDPIPVVICSSLGSDGSESALKAMEYGAADVITKPKLGTKQFLEESEILICDSVKAAYAAGAALRTSQRFVETKLNADAILPKPSGRMLPETTDKVIVVGASTGGTEALRTLLEAMPADCPGMVIVQHMPEHFTRAFAGRLDSLCKISVKEAENNDGVIRGRALIAPGNFHTLLKRAGAHYQVEVRGGPLVSRHRPSVDVLFRSAAGCAGRNAVGVIMTGMGDDGARGMKEMKDAGSFTIAQDEESCVVFGMPREAIRLGAIEQVVSLRDIAEAVLRAGEAGSSSTST